MSLPDAVIIGGGPAGTSAAIRLHRSGRRVALYDKAYFPRAKLCGGYLSQEGVDELESLGILGAMKASGAVTITRMVVASTQGTLAECELSGAALSITRDVMDDLLIREAANAGVDVHQGEDGLPHAGTSGVTVMAAGRQAILRENDQRFFPWYANSSTMYFGIQASFDGTSGVTDQVELDLIQSGYVGLARQAGGTVNVCALTTQETLHRYGPSLDAVFAHFVTENPVLRLHLRDARRSGPWKSAGPVRLGIRRLAHERTFYTGDAACVVDPFAGEGMSIGLYSSRLLVEALDQHQRPPGDVYTDLWKKSFLPALRWNAVMRALYRLNFCREPALHVLTLFPSGLSHLANLTRLRPLQSRS